MHRKGFSDFGILSEAKDWVCDFDLPDLRQGSPYAFPVDVDATSIKIDGYIISRSKKICILIELTVPFEHNIEHWHFEKLEKYQSELSHIRDWKLSYLILEVGCRGWIPGRFFSIVRNIGFVGREARRIYNNLQLVARKCSYVIWLNRFNKDFQSSTRITVSEDNQEKHLLTKAPLTEAVLSTSKKSIITAPCDSRPSNEAHSLLRNV